MVKLIKPDDGALICVKTPIQKEFEQDIENNAKIPCWASRLSDTMGLGSFPAPIHFEWEGDAEFVLSDTPDFEKILRRASGTSELDVYNLELGKTYYWKVGDSEVRSFTVELSMPRWIFAEGTYNVRDIGGYKTVDGKRVRQGMIFRGGELDGEQEGRVLTEFGIETMRDHLGIRFDLDLRASEEVKQQSSPLGENVKYCNINSESYGEFIPWKSNTKKMLKILTDKDNYPVYIHCAVGADRTGSLFGVILGLIGLSEKDMTEEYEMSTLAFPDGNRTRHEWTWPAYMGEINKYEGKDFNEKIYNYVLSCGITAEEIETIRSIMLED